VLGEPKPVGTACRQRSEVARRRSGSGDIITQVNGKPVGSTEEFGSLVRTAPKGDYIRLYVMRPQAKISFFALVKID